MRLTLFSRLSKKACWLLVTDMSSSNEISGDTFWPVVRQHYSAILVDIVRFKTYKSFMIATWLSMTSWQVHTFGHITLCNLCPESITWRWFWRLSIGKGFILYSTCPFRTLALTLANTFLVFLRSTPFSKRVWVFDEFMLEVIFHVRTISYHTCDINEERNWASFNLMTMDYSTIGCCTNRYNFIISL